LNLLILHQPQQVFPFERVFYRVFDAADGILNLALNFVGLALRLKLGVTGGSNPSRDRPNDQV
jgi:hypothetical protein